MSKLIPCSKCGGTGIRREYAHVDNGLCYKCDGSGKVNATKKQYEEYLKNAIAIVTLENEQQKKVVQIAVLRKKLFYIYDKCGNPLTCNWDTPSEALIYGNENTGFYSLLRGIKRYIKPLFNEDNTIKKWITID